MSYLKSILVLCVLLIAVSIIYSIDVIASDGRVTTYDLSQLQKEALESFSTFRYKNGRDITESWQGISLVPWLKKQGHDKWQSLRFESADNYMVRLHKAELDTMPGYLALKNGSQVLGNKEMRVIFPKQREMFWIRDIERIYLEDFQPVPKPAQMFVWEALGTKLSLIFEPEPFKAMSGYRLADLMQKLFCADEGSVVLVSRDGIRMRLEYPKHLGGAILEENAEHELNLKSPVIPAGMWLKDIVYLQCGPVALVRQDYLYQLPRLSSLLDWKLEADSPVVYKASVTKAMLGKNVLADPPTPWLNADDWLEVK